MVMLDTVVLYRLWAVDSRSFAESQLDHAGQLSGEGLRSWHGGRRYSLVYWE